MLVYAPWLILLKTLALYKPFTYLHTYLFTYLLTYLMRFCMLSFQPPAMYPATSTTLTFVVTKICHQLEIGRRFITWVGEFHFMCLCLYYNSGRRCDKLATAHLQTLKRKLLWNLCTAEQVPGITWSDWHRLYASNYPAFAPLRPKWGSTTTWPIGQNKTA